MYRFLEKFLPVGYPVDTDPIIISTIDNVVKKTKYPVVIICKTDSESRSITHKIYKNISDRELLNKLNKYCALYENYGLDDTWADNNHLGYYINFRKCGVEIEIRLFNLCGKLKYRPSVEKGNPKFYLE